MTKGEEFGPDSLLAAWLGACMLISIDTFAVRHGIDTTGARADVDVSLGGQSVTRISAIDVTTHVPWTFDEADRAGPERATAACPIKHSFRPDTEMSTRFEFGGA